MRLNFDEYALIAICRKQTRKATIDYIKEVMTYSDEIGDDMRRVAENTLGILEQMSDEEFDEFETPDIGI